MGLPAHLAINGRKPAIKERLRGLARSVDLRHGLTLSAAMILAGALDYAVNVLAGRWLAPVEFGIFISVAAILQVLLYLSLAIRSVVTFYVAELSAKGDAVNPVGIFVQSAWRWAWHWGWRGTALAFLVSPFFARLLRLPNSWPLWAASPVVLLFLLRLAADGALQGVQAFVSVGMVQLIQAFLRLLFAAGLIWLGLKAAGAIFALPLACMVVLPLEKSWLRPYFEVGSATVSHRVSWHYSSYTLLGLADFALLVNLDAMFVKHFFSPQVAGNYGTVVTLVKVSLFAPLAMGVMLLPKVAQRQVSGRDARPILALALVAAVLPGMALAPVYFFIPGLLVRTIFTGAYTNPGIILALANMAATLYAGLNIWLNYALALKRPAFIYALTGVLAWQALGMVFFGRQSLLHMELAMISAGLMGNLAGLVTTRNIGPVPQTANAGAISS